MKMRFLPMRLCPIWAGLLLVMVCVDGACTGVSSLPDGGELAGEKSSRPEGVLDQQDTNDAGDQLPEVVLEMSKDAQDALPPVPDLGKTDGGEASPEVRPQDVLSDKAAVDMLPELPSPDDALPPERLGPCQDGADCGPYACQNSGKDCVQYIPACALAQCASFSRLVKSASCGSAGVCQPKACTSNADCGPSGCRDVGSSCFLYNAVCQSGFCSSYERPGANQRCDSAKSACVGRACLSNRDCGQPSCIQDPKYCFQMNPQCNNGSCSEKTDLKLNQTCDSTTGLCGAPKPCAKDADCGQSSCRTANSICSETRVFCNAAKQCETKEGSFSNYTCDASTNKCKPPTCTKDTDCVRPLCAQRGELCEAGASTCQQGVCVRKVVSLHNQVCHLTSCMPPRTCSQLSDCGKPICADQPGIAPGKTQCVQYTPTCASGTCGFRFEHRLHGVCNKTTGTCQPKPCQLDADCGSRACLETQQGGCNQQTPRCIDKVCEYPSYYLDKSTCNGQKLCTNQCSTNADCGNSSCSDQGLNCMQTVPICRNGACVGTFRHVKLSSCQNNRGTCAPRKPCTSAADCGTSSCLPTKPGAACSEQVPTCEQGVCTSKYTQKPQHTCNTSAGTCVANSKCKSDSDCGVAGCSLSGNFCSRIVPTCDVQTGVCGTLQKGYFNSKCNAATGQCEGNQCQGAADCGKPYCSDQGVNCREVVPTCQGNVCQTQESLIKGSVCDRNKGRCQRCTKDADCGSSTCREELSRCFQNTPTCDNGRCSITSYSGPGTCTTGTCRFFHQP